MKQKIFRDSREMDNISPCSIFVGKTDKNGKKIFEGDIVYSKFLGKKICVEDFTEFLMFCGAFNERYEIDIFDTLEIVKKDGFNNE